MGFVIIDIFVSIHKDEYFFALLTPLVDLHNQIGDELLVWVGGLGAMLE